MRSLMTISLVAIMALTAGTALTAAPTGTIYVVGDVNGDFSVDQRDRDALNLYISAEGNQSVPCIEALDVNHDGKISGKDLMELDMQRSIGVAGHEWRVLEYRLGDVTKDGRVDARDYRRLEEIVYHGAPIRQQMDAADINGDGKINATDLRFFRVLLVGRR